MPFQTVVLWTDWLVYLLVLVIAATAVYVRAREHLRAPWRRVAQSVSGMIGLVVLLVFVAAGLIDSVHFRPRLAMSDSNAKAAYAVEVLSVLDLVLEPLRARREKFAEQLPDNLLVLAASLRAGQGFVGGLSAVIDETEEPSRSELRRAVADEHQPQFRMAFGQVAPYHHVDAARFIFQRDEHHARGGVGTLPADDQAFKNLDSFFHRPSYSLRSLG